MLRWKIDALDLIVLKTEAYIVFILGKVKIFCHRYNKLRSILTWEQVLFKNCFEAKIAIFDDLI